MHTGKGQVSELILEDGSRYVRVSCPSNLIPSPGQYLLAGDASEAPIAVPLFHTYSAPQSGSMGPWRDFIASAPIPDSWHPGMELYLRGPLGNGFNLPLPARKVGLIAFEVSPARLRGLISSALRQGASVGFVCNSSADHLPDEVEVQPMSALQDIVCWADYLAFDVARENLNLLRERLGKLTQAAAEKESQVLIYTPVPCGGVAECGVCAVTLKSTWKLACKDGPVFDLRELD
jgi:dihydroorotate dehydrogenase electron transfer subunit